MLYSIELRSRFATAKLVRIFITPNFSPTFFQKKLFFASIDTVENYFPMQTMWLWIVFDYCLIGVI